jgi:mono/diheme cytochrome c family protein
MSRAVFIAGFLAILAAAAVSVQGSLSAGTPERRALGSAGAPERRAREPQRTPAPRSEQAPPAAASSTSVPDAASANKTNAAAQRAVLDRYCVGCHNARLKTGGLALDQLDVSRLPDHAEVAEKVVLKLRAGMMPPPQSPRPDRATRDRLISWMEAELDGRAVTNLAAPGIHRLNRTEYQNVIRDLIGLKIDAATLLPSDNSTHGFDNIAGALTMSPALMEAYLSAAGKISRLALASNTAPTFVEYNVPDDVTQNYHVQGLPFGTRGGTLIEHEFPADGDYVFKVVPIYEGNMGQANDPFGQILGERLVVTIDGQQVKVFDWDKEIRGAPRSGVPTPPISVKAGLRKVGVTFIARNYAPDNNINDVFLRSTIETGGIPGYQFFPHLGKVRIEGPQNASRASDTPSHRKIFVCRPASGASARQEETCARTILSTLARRAYRRPVTDADIGVLMEFYASGRRAGTFDDGIEKGLRRLLADPEFVYRGEVAPASVPAGGTYRISDVALASRLSFFLWSSLPDDELLTLAEKGRLREPAALERQVRRMVADPRSAELIENFAGQWLALRALDTVQPNPGVYPDFDDNLRRAFRREVELLFDSIVQEDRSVLDLLTADYTFVDERLARHYGIPNVYGSRFRRVNLGPDLDMRRGLLGKGALMSVTSQATRTSPVTRGKWFLETFLGVSPPSPPPNVPMIKPPQQDNAGNAKEPTMRERMAMHHVNPSCSSCHSLFEPIGLSLENFDGIGAWRLEDEGQPIDTAGMLADGTKIDGVASLRDVVTANPEMFVRVVAEKLLTYGLGRGVEPQDMPLVRSIVRAAAAVDYRFSALVLGVVKSAPFQNNKKGAETSQRAAR